jgi:hypothetical protein
VVIIGRAIYRRSALRHGAHSREHSGANPLVTFAPLCTEFIGCSLGHYWDTSHRRTP